MLKKFKTIIFVIISTNSFAQQGPEITCTDCDGLSKRTMPMSGSWYNPEQSGSGYLFDIQNGYLLGYYFGYDETGNPIWRTFQNFLEESDEEGIMWEVTANFLKSSGGNAINADYQTISVEETENVINLKFRYKHFAEVNVDGGESQNIVPINFGVPARKEFVESEQQFPELEGIWSYVLNINDDSNLQLFAYFGHEFYISEKIIPPIDNGTKRISYSFMHSTFPPEAVIFSSLDCVNPVNEDIGVREVSCYINNQPTVGERMVVAPGDIGHNYIFAQNENGDTFEAFRYNYLPNYGVPVEPESN